ncbi:MAG TPA: sulfurtransferase [Hyphomicrobiaceae bacterium]|nr:sulfurtransferase [Hyphomicrobiaceae bacterium]
MQRLKVYLLALMGFVLAALPAAAADPLVSADWVKSNLGKPGIVLLDVSSGGGRSKADFVAAHIPGSVFTDYAKAGWRERNAEGVNSMLPPAAKLEKIIGALGIDNATHVVLIPMGKRAQDTGAATRLYWTFKVLGHDDVSILDGGYLGWVADVDKETKKPVNPLETGESNPQAKEFKANVRQDMIATKDDVKAAMADKEPLVDNRPNDFFLGISKSKDAKVGGTLPGATNLPEAWLTVNNGGKFRSKDQLAKLYQAAGVATTGKQINFCNTGHWASLGWFVSSEIMGNKQARMYDGSMAEWTRDDKAPVQRTIVIE